MDDIQKLNVTLAWFFEPTSWGQLVQDLGRSFRQRTAVWIVGLLVGLFLIFIRRWAQRHLSEPGPEAVFKGFGDNSLDFELRVYINGIDNWWPMLNKLNVDINNAFKEAGLTIAFPQRDVHLDATGPLEVQVVSEGSSSSTAAKKEYVPIRENLNPSPS